MLVGRLEVVAMLDELRAERLHRRVLLAAVAMWNNDDGLQAVALRGKGDTLAVVTARGGDDPSNVWVAALQPVGVDETAAHLERAERRVVLVLHPDLRARARREQRPTMLRRRLHRLVHEG